MRLLTAWLVALCLLATVWMPVAMAGAQLAASQGCSRHGVERTGSPEIGAADSHRGSHSRWAMACSICYAVPPAPCPEMGAAGRPCLAQAPVTSVWTFRSALPRPPPRA